MRYGMNVCLFDVSFYIKFVGYWKVRAFIDINIKEGDSIYVIFPCKFNSGVQQ